MVENFVLNFTIVSMYLPSVLSHYKVWLHTPDQEIELSYPVYHSLLAETAITKSITISIYFILI